MFLLFVLKLDIVAIFLNNNNRGLCRFSLITFVRGWYFVVVILAKIMICRQF